MLGDAPVHGLHHLQHPAVEAHGADTYGIPERSPVTALTRCHAHGRNARDEQKRQAFGGLGTGLACSARATATRLWAAASPVECVQSFSVLETYSSSPGPGPLFQYVQAWPGIV